MAAHIDTGADRSAHRTRAEVNVTPFVDVMLVLLIVFMVAAPIATIAVPLDLSNVDGPAVPAKPPVFVSLQDNGTIYVGTQDSGEVPANWATFAQTIDQTTGGDRNRRVLIRADQRVPYASVMRLMDELHRRGYRNKMLVTEDVAG